MKLSIATTVLLTSQISLAQPAAFESIDAIQAVANSKAIINTILSQSNTTEVTSIAVEENSGSEFSLVVTTHAMDVPCVTPVSLASKKGQLVVKKIGKTNCGF